MWSDFRRFIMRGNVVDLAIGVVIGTAFTAIVNSLVDDIIMPIIAGLFGGESFESLTIEFNGATIAYGSFIQAIINFLLIALVVFLVIRYAIRFSQRMGMEATGLEGLVPDSEREEQEEPEPVPSQEIVLLSEIRDILYAQSQRE